MSSGDRFVLHPEDVQMNTMSMRKRQPPKKAAPKKAKAKPMKTAVRVIAKPTSDERIPGAEEVEKKGIRYVRTYAGQERFGVPIGHPIPAGVDIPFNDPHRYEDYYTAHTEDELHSTYHGQRWSKKFEMGDSPYEVRLMGDGDVVITYPNTDTPGPEDHVVWFDGIETDAAKMQATMKAFTEARSIAESWEILDDEDRETELEESGYVDTDEHYVAVVAEPNTPFVFGIYPTGEIDVSHDNGHGYPDQSVAHTIGSADDLYALQDALDDAWSADISGEGLPEEEEEEPQEGITPWFDADRNVGFVQYEDGEPFNSVTFTQAEGQQLVRVYDEFKPMEVPGEDDEWPERHIGEWVISMGPNAEINFHNPSKNIGMEIEWEDFERGIDFIRNAVSQQL